jgi:hypothetical protein
MSSELWQGSSGDIVATPQHVEVYRKPGEFAGWPADYGLRLWEDEVVVFSRRVCWGHKGKIRARNRDHPFRPRQAQSLDGGMTWAAEPFSGHVPGAAPL